MRPKYEYKAALVAFVSEVAYREYSERRIFLYDQKESSIISQRGEFPREHYEIAGISSY